MEVISLVGELFEKNGFNVKREVSVRDFRVDIVAEKKNKKFFIECRGDKYLRAHELHVILGQIVSEMCITNSNVHYCLAMPLSLSSYLKGFCTDGFKLLNLHLFIVFDRGVLEGEVYYLDSDRTITFIQELASGNNEYFSLIRLRCILDD